MPEPAFDDRRAVPVRMRVVHGGAEVADEGTLRLEDDAVLLTAGRRRVRAAFDRLAGLTWDSPHLTLHTLRGDVIELQGATELGGVAEAITRRICTMPEMTRALRAFGLSTASEGVPADELFFAALLSARRDAEAASSAEARLVAFDAATLRASIEAAIARAAAVREPVSPPHRRALEAVLAEAAEPLFVALDRLAATEVAARAGDGAGRFVAWRAWVEAARHVFQGADRASAAAARELFLAGGSR